MRLRTFPRLALPVALAIAPAARALAAQPRPTPATILPLERFGRHGRTIAVVAGRDTLDFLFDTGGGVTAISPALAERLGCTPTGRLVGFRMTGEKVETRTCAHVELGVGPLRVSGPAAVIDLARMLGPGAKPVHGQIALHSLAGRAITLDLAHDRLILESPATLATRTRGMTRVPARLAATSGGAALDLFVGVPAARGADTLWLEWDSGHGAPTFLAPHALPLLGLADSARGGEPALRFGAVSAVVPVATKDVIYDGVLNAATLARGVWTADLATGRLWVSALAPIPVLPPAAGAARGPADGVAGVYELTIVDRGHAEPAVLELTERDGALAGVVRPSGTDDLLPVRNVRFVDGTLTFEMQMNAAYPFTLRFTGAEGTGTWGSDARGGRATAVKRS